MPDQLTPADATAAALCATVDVPYTDANGAVWQPGWLATETVDEYLVRKGLQPMGLDEPRDADLEARFRALCDRSALQGRPAPRSLRQRLRAAWTALTL